MRRPNWAFLLGQYLQSRKDVPFEYGSNDCCSFAAGAIDAVTGRHCTQDLRHLYEDEKGANALIDQHGGLEQAVSVIFGRASSPPEWAIVGDIVLCDGDHGPTVGVFLGQQIAIATPEGVKAIDSSAAKRSWRVQ